MTDKQIIIDGCDVADCEHINACDKKMKCVILQDDVCETNPYCEGFNCYYKQLKRLEKLLPDINGKFYKAVDDLKIKEQECEELKKERDTLSVTRNKLLDDLWIAEENLKEYIEHFNKASEQLDQLKQTLIEIKDYCNKYPQNSIGFKQQILQKISEVEE